MFVPGMTDIADDYVEFMPFSGAGPSSSRSEATDEALPRGRVRSRHLEHRRRRGRRRGDRRAGPRGDVLAAGPRARSRWALANPDRVRSLAIGDYVPEEKVLPTDISRRLLERPVARNPRQRAHRRRCRDQDLPGRARTVVLGRACPACDFRCSSYAAATAFLVGDRRWARYKALFPHAHLVEFDDSPHDIFRPDRGRYPRLVHEHVNRRTFARWLSACGPQTLPATVPPSTGSTVPVT